jgi:hypothetical protein
MSVRNGVAHDRGDEIENVDVSLDGSAKDAELPGIATVA